MTPQEAALFVAAVLVVMFVGVTLLIVASRDKTEPTTEDDRILAALCDAHEGLKLTLGSGLVPPSARGTMNGLHVSIRLVDQQQQQMQVNGFGVAAGPTHRRVVEIEVSGGKMLADAIILPRGTHSTATIAGGQPLKHGDPVLARDGVLRTAQPDRLMSVLDVDARAAIGRALADGDRLEHGTWRIRLPALIGVQALQTAIERCGEAIEALQGRGEPPEVALERIARTDPVPEVRARALQAWMRLGTPPRAALKELADAGGPAAVVAASALGDEGVQVLLGCLADPTTRRHAALTVSQRTEVPAALRGPLDRALIAELDHQPTRNQVIDALGRHGTVAAVPALARFRDGGLFSGADRQRASQAIRAIQARAEGADAGQLSMAALQAEQGAVSVAARQAGRVAEKR